MNEVNQPVQGEEKPARKSMESLREAHRIEILRQTEEAKDPAAYETYAYSGSAADENLRLFTVKRRGLGHIDAGKPCQDHCAAVSVNGCTVLADADGVSACEHSDVGARLACEAVVLAVQAASESSDGEDRLVARLLSVSFRERLVSIWVKAVMEEVDKEPDLTPEARLKAFAAYGSTVMFAVITQTRIVAGCLGDGQILVFNGDFGVKLRVHGPKESSRVRCLLNERCAREDFTVAQYPRSVFNGVLLTTDGIYESLDKGEHLYRYAMQLRERFLGREPLEPYQPFCYEEEGEPNKDFSRMRTFDDCSIAMAIDERPVISDHAAVMNGLMRRAVAAMLRDWTPECASYYTKTEDGCVDVNVTCAPAPALPPEGLLSAGVEAPLETRSEGELVFTAYAESEAPTLAFLHCAGLLRRSGTDDAEADVRRLRLYLGLSGLQKELKALGLRLNASAMFNVRFDGARLYLRREAVSPAAADGDAEGFDAAQVCFPHLLGTLACEEKTVAVYDPGYLDRGPVIFSFSRPGEAFAQLQRADKQLCLKNAGDRVWLLEDGAAVQPGKWAALQSKLQILLSGGEEETPEIYTYTAKELL